MTAYELFTQLIKPETVEPAVAEALLSAAGETVKNRMYPFGYDDSVVIPRRYEHVQAKIAVEMYTKMGAEGELTHTVGDVQRVYESGDVSQSLLNQIIPYVSGVIR